jgi:hypothetical protein
MATQRQQRKLRKRLAQLQHKQANADDEPEGDGEDAVVDDGTASSSNSDSKQLRSATTDSTVPVYKHIRVLYMHGLSSGPKGRKCRVLQQHFTTECASTLHLNSSLHALCCGSWHAWALVLAVLCTCLAFGVCLLCATMRRLRSTRIIGTCVVITVLLCYATYRYALPLLLRSLVTRAARIQSDALRRFKPDIVVGSSFGAGLAVLALMRREWRGPTLLLAGAALSLARHTRCVERSALLERGLGDAAFVHFVHARGDSTVPVQHSRDLAAAARLQLGAARVRYDEVTEPKGGKSAHSLGKATRTAALVAMVRALYKHRRRGE